MINKIGSIQRDIATMQANMVDLCNLLKIDPNIKNTLLGNLDIKEIRNLSSTFLFFTEKKISKNIRSILSNIGIKEGLNPDDFFVGKLKVSLPFNYNASVIVHFIHCDNYLFEINNDVTHLVKFIIYDREFLKEYQNWNLMKEVLEADPALHIMIDVSENQSQNFAIALNNIHQIKIQLEDLKDSIFSVLHKESTPYFLQLVVFNRFLLQVQKIHQILEKKYLQQFNKFRGTAMLLAKETYLLKKEMDQFAKVDTATIKTKINDNIKQKVEELKKHLREFEEHQKEYQEVISNTMNFLGFVETKQSKALVVSISEGAIQNKLNKTASILKKFYQSELQELKSFYKQQEQNIQQLGESQGIQNVKLGIHKIDKKAVKEALKVITPIPGKTYEQNISSKGTGSILMELRKPLYMLMPVMMIIALFGALTSGGEKGTVQDNTLFHNSRPSIAITSLPANRNGQFVQFVKDLENLRKSDKNIFVREVRGEFLTLPQFATKDTLVQNKATKKFENKNTLDYHYDRNSQVLYLYLTDNADRSFVIQQLFDPAHKLLSYEAASRRSYGIGAIIRVLSGFKEYRYFIILGVSILVLWFIITRKTGMKKEHETTMAREQQKLNGELRLQIEKVSKLSLQKFQALIVENLREYKNSVLETLDINYIQKQKQLKTSKEEELQKVTEMKNNLRTKKIALSQQRRMLDKITSKSVSLNQKITRLY